MQESGIDNSVAPTVFDIANGADQRFFGEASAPIICSAHELLHNLRRPNLKQVHSTSGQAESPDMRSSFRVAGRRKRAGDGLAKEVFTQVLRVVHPVATAYNAAGRFIGLGFLAHGLSRGVEREETKPALFDDGEAFDPITVFGFLVSSEKVVLVLQDAFFSPGSTRQLEAFILEQRSDAKGFIDLLSVANFFANYGMAEGIGKPNRLLVFPLRVARSVGVERHGGLGFPKGIFTPCARLCR